MTKASKWRRYGNYAFLLPLFAMVLFYQITYSVVTISVALHRTEAPTRPFATDNRNVTGVDDSIRRAGLQVGDKILSINGQAFTGDRVLFEQIRNAKRGAVLTLSIIPNGESASRTVRVPVHFQSDNPGTFWSWLIPGVLLALMMFCVLVGIYVAAVLPFDIRAITTFGLMIATSQIVTIAAWYHFPRPLWVFANIYRTAGTVSWSVWLILFALYFPHRFSWDTRRPWIKWLFLGPVIAWASAASVASLGAYFSFDAFAPLDHFMDSPVLDVRLLMSLAITFYYAAIGTKAGRSVHADSRRRMRILMVGTSVGLVPVGLFVAYQALTHGDEFNHISEVILVTVCLLFCLFPLTLAYVVVAERAMNLRMVIRHGLRYALAKGGVRVLLGLMMAGLITVVSNVVFGSMLNPTAKISLFVAAVVIASLIIRRTRVRLQKWIDRRFFREAYNTEKILEDLSETVLTIMDERKLLDTVTHCISESLHVPQISVLLNGDGAFRPVYCLGFEPKPDLGIPEDSKTVQVVKESKEARVYFDRRDNWVHDAPESELVTLRNIHTQLLVPVGAKNRLLGLLSLGPKRSEEPYSSSDVHLLRSVAVQTAFALENTRLASAVAKEMAEREKLNREMEIAREVQERLFPQKMPAIAGIDFYGACRPALGVGGDYYDFLPLANGGLGIAIGDVSGKGIAAALLMASLQASLRGQAMMNQGDLARLMQNVNQLVYDATPINRYATFFYGQYDGKTHVFTYVNAGHNAPILVRRTNNGVPHVIRLETGGPVVGIFPNAPYQQGTLLIEPGDIFVGFTDGISEAMNKEEEEWGEGRLIPAVAKHADDSAADMIPALMRDADSFVAGAPQHDDMTLVVLKACAA